MPAKYGQQFIGQIRFGDSDPVAKKQVSTEYFTPRNPSFVTEQMAKEMRRRLRMAITQWGMKGILYVRKTKGNTLTRELSFTGSSPYSYALWQRGTESIPSPNHPDSRSIQITVNGIRMTQVRKRSELSGTFSFYVLEADDSSSVEIIFSNGFTPTGKKVVCTYETICICFDYTTGQSQRPDCEVCFGTGLEGGYTRFFNVDEKDGIIWVRRRQNLSSKDLEMFGYNLKDRPQFYSLPEPRISNTDFIEIVSSDFAGKRYHVKNMDFHYIGDKPTSQWFNLNEVQTNDPIYKVKQL